MHHSIQLTNGRTVDVSGTDGDVYERDAYVVIHWRQKLDEYCREERERHREYIPWHAIKSYRVFGAPGEDQPYWDTGVHGPRAGAPEQPGPAEPAWYTVAYGVGNDNAVELHAANGVLMARWPIEYLSLTAEAANDGELIRFSFLPSVDPEDPDALRTRQFRRLVVEACDDSAAPRWRRVGLPS
jgi:hypothetical protein